MRVPLLRLPMRGFVFFLLLLSALQLVSVAMMTVETSSVRVDGLRQRLRQLVLSPLMSDTRKSNGVILIDGDNVRGKTKFQLSKEELCHRVQEWMTISSLSGVVVLMFDHGSKHSGTFIPDSKLAVVFSGPGRSADDVITRDVGWFQNIQQRDVVVITEDNGLKRRCRTSLKGRASARGKQKKGVSPAAATDTSLTNSKSVPKELTFVGSPLFAEMLMAMRPLTSSSPSPPPSQSTTITTTPTLTDNNEKQSREGGGGTGTGTNPMMIGSSPSGTLETVGGLYNPQIALIRKEVDLRRQLSGLRVALSNRKCTRKTALKLRAKEVELKRRLGLIVAAAKELKESGVAKEAGLECDVESTTELESELGLDLDADLESGLELDAELEPGSGSGSELEGDLESGLEESGVELESESESGSGLESGSGSKSGSPNVVDRGAELLAKLLAQGRPAGTVEETWERIILAEQLRYQLEQQYGSLGGGPLPGGGSFGVLTQEAAGKEEEKSSSLPLHGMDVNTNRAVDNVSASSGDGADPGALYVSYINRNFAQPSRATSVSSSKKRQ